MTKARQDWVWISPGTHHQYSVWQKQHHMINYEPSQPHLPLQPTTGSTGMSPSLNFEHFNPVHLLWEWSPQARSQLHTKFSLYCETVSSLLQRGLLGLPQQSLVNSSRKPISCITSFFLVAVFPPPWSLKWLFSDWTQFHFRKFLKTQRKCGALSHWAS